MFEKRRLKKFVSLSTTELRTNVTEMIMEDVRIYGVNLARGTLPLIIAFSMASPYHMSKEPTVIDLLTFIRKKQCPSFREFYRSTRPQASEDTQAAAEIIFMHVQSHFYLSHPQNQWEIVNDNSDFFVELVSVAADELVRDYGNTFILLERMPQSGRGLNS